MMNGERFESTGAGAVVLSNEEVQEVNGGVSVAVWGVAVALGAAAYGAFATGVQAGYALGMEIWGKK